MACMRLSCRLLVCRIQAHKPSGVQSPYIPCALPQRLCLPQAVQVVHVVRHPLDVALSCFAQPFEGRGTPWAWSLAGASAALRASRDMASSSYDLCRLMHAVSAAR